MSQRLPGLLGSTLVALTLGLVSCSDSDGGDNAASTSAATPSSSNTTETSPSSETSAVSTAARPTVTELEQDTDGDGAPTPAAVAADEAFRAVPDGYIDCGATNLTSGWPTTAPYFAASAQCIGDAAQSGDRSQYAYYGRDHNGGIDATILRVDGPGNIVMVEYHITQDGVLDSTETTCSHLTAPSVAPPVCDT